jgi:nicotinate phosphoribosyltransferase
MIKSLLDTDLYKQSMGYVFWKKYPTVKGEYVFICRNKDVKLGFLKDQVIEEVARIAQLRYTLEEINYLKSLNLFGEDYTDYLKSFKLNAHEVVISEHHGDLVIRISGTMVSASPWEIYLLATINELYFKHLNPNLDLSLGKQKLADKIDLIKSLPNNFKIMEFGTRRRYSSEWQKYVLQTLAAKLPEHLIGTSNILLAKELGLKPVGTLAHEYLSSQMVLAPDFKHFQHHALKVWQEVYQDKLLVSLTDLVTTDSFLKDLDEELSNSFTGLRHDSGDPIVWGEKILNHYQKYDINPQEKTLIFSDGLDVPKAISIFNHFKDKTKLIFGIGTNLTNDVGLKALNIVIKMVSCDNHPVAKISDEPSKAICEDPAFLQKVKITFGVKS